MTRETWTVYSPPAPAGYVLTDGWVRDVETREGLYKTPAHRGANGAAGQVHGSEWTRKPYGEGSFQQQLWLMADVNREQLEQWYDELLRAIAWPYDLVLVRRKLADGSERDCYAELVTAIEPTPMGQLGMRVGLDWTIPAGFWRDTAARTDTFNIAGVGSGANVAFNDLRGGTAPFPVTLNFSGPLSAGTRFTQPLTGDWVYLETTLSATQLVTLESESGLAIVYDSATGITSPFYAFSYSGAVFMEMPGVASPVDLLLGVSYSGAGPGVGAFLGMTGTRRWLA